jgi:hypothetical protein
MASGHRFDTDQGTNRPANRRRIRARIGGPEDPESGTDRQRKRQGPRLRSARPQEMELAAKRKTIRPSLEPLTEYPKGGSPNDQKCDGKNDPLSPVFGDDIPITPHECVMPIFTFALLPPSRPVTFPQETLRPSTAGTTTASPR